MVGIDAMFLVSGSVGATGDGKRSDGRKGLLHAIAERFQVQFQLHRVASHVDVPFRNVGSAEGESVEDKGGVDETTPFNDGEGAVGRRWKGEEGFEVGFCAVEAGEEDVQADRGGEGSGSGRAGGLRGSGAAEAIQ